MTRAWVPIPVVRETEYCGACVNVLSVRVDFFTQERYGIFRMHLCQLGIAHSGISYDLQLVLDQAGEFRVLGPRFFILALDELQIVLELGAIANLLETLVSSRLLLDAAPLFFATGHSAQTEHVDVRSTGGRAGSA